MATNIVIEPYCYCMYTFRVLTCSFNSKLSLIFLWLATRPLRLVIFDSKSEISFSIFSSSTVLEHDGLTMTSFMLCWLLENDFRNAFSISLLPRIIRKIVTHFEEEKISLPNYLFYHPWTFREKKSARRIKLKREIMNPERERMLQMAELQAMKDVLNSLLDVCHPR